MRFHAYLTDYCSIPLVWAPEGGKPLKCDWIFSTVAALMETFGMSRAEAWDTSPGEAAWLLVAAGERKGEIDLVSEAENAAAEALLREDAAAEAEKEAAAVTDG